MMKLPLRLLAVAAISVLAACDRGPNSDAAVFPGDTERVKVAAEAAAKTAQVITQKIGEAYGTNQPINVHVQVGDIVVLGFDEGIDAEEWGMTEISNEGAAGAGSGKSAAVQADQAPAAAGERKISRSIDVRKGSIYLIASEDSEALEETAPAEATAPAQKAGQ